MTVAGLVALALGVVAVIFSAVLPVRGLAWRLAWLGAASCSVGAVLLVVDAWGV